MKTVHGSTEGGDVIVGGSVLGDELAVGDVVGLGTRLTAVGVDVGGDVVNEISTLDTLGCGNPFDAFTLMPRPWTVKPMYSPEAVKL